MAMLAMLGAEIELDQDRLVCVCAREMAASAGGNMFDVVPNDLALQQYTHTHTCTFDAPHRIGVAGATKTKLLAWHRCQTHKGAALRRHLLAHYISIARPSLVRCPPRRLTHLFGPEYRRHRIAGGLALQRDGATFAGGQLARLRHRPDAGRNCHRIGANEATQKRNVNVSTDFARGGRIEGPVWTDRRF